MQQENRTAAQWEEIIGNLSSRGRNADAEVVALASEGDQLSLDAELGVGDTAQRLKKLRAEQLEKLVCASNLQAALEAAKQRHAEALEREAAEAEKKRQEQLPAASKQLMEAARLIDDSLRALAARFAAFRQALDRLEAVASGSERQALQQVRSLFGPTLACAYHGLHEFVELGPRAGHIPHRKPLADYVQTFVAAWIGAGKE
jgi:hypothetical protein